MAARRTLECPSCREPRVTKATGRQRLRCDHCGAFFFAGEAAELPAEEAPAAAPVAAPDAGAPRRETPRPARSSPGIVVEEPPTRVVTRRAPLVDLAALEEQPAPEAPNGPSEPPAPPATPQAAAGGSEGPTAPDPEPAGRVVIVGAPGSGVSNLYRSRVRRG